MPAHSTPERFGVRSFAQHLLVTAAIVLVFVLGVAPAARAETLLPPPPPGADCQSGGNGTHCSWTETFATPFPVPYGVSCGTFSVRVDLRGERQVTAFYDASGTLK